MNVQEQIKALELRIKQQQDELAQERALMKKLSSKNFFENIDVTIIKKSWVDDQGKTVLNYEWVQVGKDYKTGQIKYIPLGYKGKSVQFGRDKNISVIKGMFKNVASIATTLETTVEELTGNKQ